VAFRSAIEGAQKLSLTQVIDALDEALGPHFFPARADGSDPRRCPNCGNGRLGLKVGKFGGFIGCSNYPECRYTRQLAIASEREDAMMAGETREIGNDPETGAPIVVKEGPYGPYLQLGEKIGKEKPKRVSVPKGFDPMAIDLDTARQLLALPRSIGEHPAKGGQILAGIGRFGPYIQHGREYRRLPQPSDVLTIGINHAVALLDEPPKRGMRVKVPERSLGNDPNSGEAVAAGVGRYGPYVRRGKSFASLKKDQVQDTVTLEDALALLEEKASRGKTAGVAAVERKTSRARVKRPKDAVPPVKARVKRKKPDSE
jgi:DNA topoisomerase-1